MLTATRTLGECLQSTARARPDSVALMAGGHSVTYKQLVDYAMCISHFLAGNGVSKGDRVALLMSNSIEFASVFWAVQFMGAVAVPLNKTMRRQKLARILADCEPAAIVIDTEHSEVFNIVKEIASEVSSRLWCSSSIPVSFEGTATPDRALQGPIDVDLASIIYTSGSTGESKGVVLTHLNMIAASSSVVAYLEVDRADRIFCALPFSFDYGLHQLIMAAAVGCTLIVEPSFANPLYSLHRVAKHSTTILPVVPSMASLIEPFASRFDLRSVRMVTSTGAALHPTAIDSLRRSFPSARIFSMYGVTECHRCTYLAPEQLDKRKSSVGKAIPNTEVWVVDSNGRRHDRDATGELVVRGSTVMRGYWRDIEQTKRKLRPGPGQDEMVLFTGDICRLDEEGFVYFISRTDDMLNINACKVAPLEVERGIAGHPAVANCVIVGVPDDLRDTKLVAFVQLKNDNPCTCEELRSWCENHLEPEHMPAEFRFVSSLPRSANGKVDMTVLRESAIEKKR